MFPELSSNLPPWQYPWYVYVNKFNTVILEIIFIPVFPYVLHQNVSLFFLFLLSLLFLFLYFNCLLFWFLLHVP